MTKPDGVRIILEKFSGYSGYDYSKKENKKLMYDISQAETAIREYLANSLEELKPQVVNDKTEFIRYGITAAQDRIRKGGPAMSSNMGS